MIWLLDTVESCLPYGSVRNHMISGCRLLVLFSSSLVLARLGCRTQVTVNTWARFDGSEQLSLLSVWQFGTGAGRSWVIITLWDLLCLATRCLVQLISAMPLDSYSMQIILLLSYLSCRSCCVVLVLPDYRFSPCCQLYSWQILTLGILFSCIFFFIVFPIFFNKKFLSPTFPCECSVGCF